MKPTHNYYEATKNNLVQFPELDGDIKTDICVIGAGFTGLGTALELAIRGYSVVVLEASRIGSGASGKSGGQVASGYSPGMMETSAIVGSDDARLLWEFSEDAKRILNHRIAKHEIRCDYLPGELYAAPKKSHITWLKDEKNFVENEYGYAQYRWIDTDHIREMMAGKRYIGGLLDLEGAHLHPLNYTLGLAKAASAAGVQIFENSAAVSYDAHGQVVVHCDKGRITADSLVLAGNAYLKGVEPFLQKRMVPVNSSIIATEPLGAERAAKLMKTSACVADTYYDLDYFKITPDTRLVYGGQDLSFGKASRQNNPIRTNMLKTFPMLKDVNIEYMWSGSLSVTRHRLPDAGRIGKNVYYAHGYSGQGVTLSAVMSKILAEAISGGMERLDVFGRLPHKSVPAAKFIQFPLVYSMLLWNKLKDLL
ncbi:MAG: FAD-binding oxidoreductase [Sneathiella sp.]|nr:FAD-binding oxidoreductase [Sneathiella sp.]